MNQRAGAGFYGPSLTMGTNPLAALTVYQLGSRTEAQQVSSLEAVALNRSLIESVQAIALVHEGYILQRMGEKAYLELIAGVPSYLAEGFVKERVAILLTHESGNAMVRSG
jgi:hypothetical protein